MADQNIPPAPQAQPAATAPVQPVVQFVFPVIHLDPISTYEGGFLHTEIFTKKIGADNPLTRGLSRAILGRNASLESVRASGEAFHQRITDEDLALMVHLISIVRCISIGKRAEDDTKLCSTGELLVVHLPVELCDPNAEITITTLVLQLLNSPMGILNDETFMFDNRTVNIPCPTTNVSFLHAIAILGAMTASVRGQYRKFMLDMHVEFYVSMSVRGTISDPKLQRIISQLTEQTGQTHNLSERRVRLVYQSYGKYITPENAHNIFKDWQRLIPANAMQLKLVLSQASYGGLTQLVTIGKAFPDFPDFPWISFHAFPGEFHAFNLSMDIVKGNPYYGYTRDLGRVASRHYANLAYGCKELLVRSGGNDSLTRYMGWLRTCKHHAAVIEVITKYLDQSTGTITNPGSASNPTVRLSLHNATLYSALVKGEAGVGLVESPDDKNRGTSPTQGSSGGDGGASTSGTRRSREDQAEQPASQRPRSPGTEASIQDVAMLPLGDADEDL